MQYVCSQLQHAGTGVAARVCLWRLTKDPYSTCLPRHDSDYPSPHIHSLNPTFPPPIVTCVCAAVLVTYGLICILPSWLGLFSLPLMQRSHKTGDTNDAHASLSSNMVTCHLTVVNFPTCHLALSWPMCSAFSLGGDSAICQLLVFCTLLPGQAAAHAIPEAWIAL